MDHSWQPTASLEVLRLRARLMARVRRFFAARAVLEVETPTLSAAATPAPHLDSFSIAYHGPAGPASGQLHLHTSPEFPMKRLLAAGSGSIYQLCRVFRDGEAGARHNPEFTLLEWYRVDVSLAELIAEVEMLVRTVLTGVRELPLVEHYTYQTLFQRYADLDGLAATSVELRDCLLQQGHQPPTGLCDTDIDAWRDLVLTHIIEPQLSGLVFVTEYPASQAALARISPHNAAVAERFECYLDGVELANGFHELSDAVEQRRRFEQENAARSALGRPKMPLDESMLAALAAGLPDCCGVALGFDRLLMRAVDAKHIKDILAFGIDRA